MAVVTTIEGKCRRCYSCIRNCPAKAIKVEKGQSKVIEERCVTCGSCIKVCAQNAKRWEDAVPPVRELLGTHRQVVACLAPSFPAFFHDCHPLQVVNALKRLGFNKVMEVAFGAELIVRNEYIPLLRNDSREYLITSPCPALVKYIEKFAPDLLEYLAPVVSPAVALGRYIKKFINPDAAVVFIGPCLAKKAEIHEEAVKGAVEEALTFIGLSQMIVEAGIDMSKLEDVPFDGPTAELGRLFAISGGLLRTSMILADLRDNEIIVAEGKQKILPLLDGIRKKALKSRFFDLLLCEGCIDGPFMNGDHNLFTRKEKVSDFCRAAEKLEIPEVPGLDLRRTFAPEYLRSPVPTEEQLLEILRAINKTKPEDEFNCGVCGYESCREKAVAVFNGLAENEMCLPYLLEKLEQTQEALVHTEKMSSLGQMAAGVAHEINNPLAGALVYIRLLLKKLSQKEPQRDEFDRYLTSIEKEIVRCSRIIRNLLDFARPKEPLFKTTLLNDVLNDSVDLLRHQVELSNVSLIYRLSETLPPVLADPDQLRQVYVNIILNALQAMPDGGTLTITTDATGDGNEVWVSFTDTGCGIPKENIGKLFTPFFTTKGEKKGVGLGLAVVHGIIKNNNGKISVASEVGKGSTFTITMRTQKT
jgi:signal transduction histidine kinase/NAD-dependent dihydropyrimidine dehydrogenase PreA subunit